MKIIRGTSVSLMVQIRDEEGMLYELQEGDKLIFGVKQNPNNKSYSLKKTADSTAKTDDGYIINLAPEDTANLPFGKYVFDVGLQTAEGNFYMVVECDSLIIDTAVTSKEGGT